MLQFLDLSNIFYHFQKRAKIITYNPSNIFNTCPPPPEDNLQPIFSECVRTCRKIIQIRIFIL